MGNARQNLYLDLNALLISFEVEGFVLHGFRIIYKSKSCSRFLSSGRLAGHVGCLFNVPFSSFGRFLMVFNRDGAI